jgi:hypothetical protein
MAELKHSAQARKILKKHLTPRYKSLDTLEAYYENRQYAGLPSWFKSSVPLMQRAPCIVEPITESAIESYQDLILGEGRFPVITAKVEEDDKAFDPQFGLDAEDSVQMDHLVRAAIKQSNFEETAREALADAMSSRTAVVIVSVKDGCLALDLEPAKACTPTFDQQRPTEIVSLEIKYPYIDVYWDSVDKCWAERCMLYRRVINAVEDIVFLPALAPESGEQPQSWTPQITVPHGFGFCPVVWYPHRKISCNRRDADGIAIHEKHLPEIDALNRVLSQRHRAGLYCGDPQIIETGTSEDETPGQLGPDADMPRMFVDEAGQVVNSAAEAHSAYIGAGGGTGRKKSPDGIWQYASKDAKVAYLVLPEGSLRTIDEDADRLRSLIAEGMAWVRPLEASSSNSKLNVSRLSSKTLSLLYKRQTSQCDLIRPNVWSGLLMPLINMLLRVIHHYASGKGNGALYLGGVKESKKLLDRFLVDIEGSGTRWFRPTLKPMWGPYFPPDETDELALSTQVKLDHEAGFITTRTAVEKRAAFYKIDDVEAYLQKLEEDVKKRKDEETERAVNEASQLHEAIGGNEDSGGDA